jgi:DnaK suppressor protein
MENKEAIRQRLVAAANEALDRSNGVQLAIATLDPAGNLSFEEHGTEREFDDVLEQLSDRTRRELIMVMHAFERLERGGYGECDECGHPIPSARLKALPFAEQCVDCATKLERG